MRVCTTVQRDVSEGEIFHVLSGHRYSFPLWSRNNLSTAKCSSVYLQATNMLNASCTKCTV